MDLSGFLQLTVAVLLVLFPFRASADLAPALSCIRTAGLSVVDSSQTAALQSASQTWQLLNTTVALAVVSVSGVDQIQKAVLCLYNNNIQAVPRGGGHSYAGLSVLPNAVTIDLSGLNSISLSSDLQTVTLGAGVTHGQAYYQIDQLANHTKTIVGGSDLGVGVVGLVLGGGFGFLSRQYGLACDQLRSLRMVDYKGDIVTADSSQNADLFWASCGGGGGNLGIVVEMTLGLVDAPSTTTTCDCSSAFSYSQTTSFVQYWMQTVTPQADPKLGLQAVISNGPFSVNVQYPGSVAEAQAAMAAAGLSATSTYPLSCTCTAGSWLDSIIHWSYSTVVQAGHPENMLSTAAIAKAEQEYSKLKSIIVTPDMSFTSSAIQTLQNFAGAPVSGDSYVAFSAWGPKSAIAARDAGATAFPYRTGLQLIQYGIEWHDSGASASNLGVISTYATSLTSSIGPSPPVYVNYMDLQTPMTAYYGNNLVRLQSVKAAYDPQNYFANPASFPYTPSQSPTRLTSPPPQSSGAGQVGSSTPPSTSASAVFVPSSTTSTSSSSSGNGPPIGAIVGGVVGGVVVVAIAGLTVFFLVYKRRRNPNELPAAPTIITTPWSVTHTTMTMHMENASHGMHPHPTRPEVTLSDRSTVRRLNWSLAPDEPQSSVVVSSTNVDVGQSYYRQPPHQLPWIARYVEFEFIQPISDGAASKSYLVKWKGQVVAAEILLAGGTPIMTAGDDRMIHAVHKEADDVLALRHTNVCQFLGLSFAPICIISEYCSLGPVGTLLKAAREDRTAGSRLTWARRVAFAQGAAEGLSFLHEHGHVHGALSSATLLISEDWTAKVADANSRRIKEEAINAAGIDASNVPAVDGWPGARAPEVIGGGQYGLAADVFAFGVVLWELLTWKQPWMGDNPWVVAQKVLRGDRLPIPSEADLPGQDTPPAPELATYITLMQKCWAQEPRERPSFRSIAETLKTVA